MLAAIHSMFRRSLVLRLRAEAGTGEWLHEAIARYEQTTEGVGGLRGRLRLGDAGALAFRQRQVTEWHDTGRGLAELRELAAGQQLDALRAAAMVLERRGLLRRASTWTAALSAMARAGDALGARRLAEKMEAPTTIAYNAVLRACANSLATSLANEVLLERMPARGVEPDAVSFATAVAAQTSWDERARRWMRQACDMGDARGKLLSCREAMRLCARVRNADEAVRILLEEMPRCGLEPSARDFREATHACAAAGRVDEAWRVLELAQDRGLDSDATWARVVSVCSRCGGVDDARRAYARLGERRRPGSAVVANGVLKAMAGKGEGDAAEDFLRREVVAKEHPTDADSYAWAMRARVDDWRKCLGLLAEARKAGHPLTAEACVPALEALAFAGETAVLADLVDEMKRRGLELPDAGVAAVVRCQIVAGSPREGLLAFQRDPRPAHAGAVRAALEACAAAREPDDAVSLFDEYSRRAVKIEGQVVKACAAALGSAARWREALDLVTVKCYDASRRGAYDAALSACLSGLPGESEEPHMSLGALQELLPRLQAAADCWDQATARGLYAEPGWGKRDRVLTIDVHGTSVPVALAATLATLRCATRAAKTPPTLSVVTGTAARRSKGPTIQPAIARFLKFTFKMASVPSETNPGILTIPAPSVLAWAKRFPEFSLWREDGRSS